jgi:glycosyltransferase involved in cell wall biosynthesis/GT2 family glycosyltransferase
MPETDNRISSDEGGAPLVSVVVRSIGRSELSEALDSVALQTYSNIEVVVVNAKGPGHPELGERCGRFPLRVCGTGKAIHRSCAANFGLDNARGEYLIFLDDDDWFLPEHVAALVQALVSGGGAKAAYAGVQCLHETAEHDWEQVHVYNDPFDRTKLFIENQLPIHAVLFSRELVVDGCRFDEDLEIYEDWDFWLQVCLRTDLLHVLNVSAVYRISLTGGFGVTGDEITAYQSAAKIFDKWRYYWSKEQLTDIMYYMKTHSDTGREYARREALLRDRMAQLEKAEVLLQGTYQELHLIRESRSWRVTRPLRAVTTLLRRLKLGVEGWSRRWRHYAAAASQILWRQGARALLARAYRRLMAKPTAAIPPLPRPVLASAWRPLVFPVRDRVEVSFIVLARGDFRHTYTCLESILAQGEGLGYEVIVVAAADEEIWRMLQAMQGIRAVSCGEEDLPRRHRDLAMQARGDFLVFLRDSVALTPGWVVRMVETFKRDDRIGLASPQIVSEKGALLSAGGAIDPEGEVTARGQGESPYARAEYNCLGEVDCCAPACFISPREFFIALGEFEMAEASPWLQVAQLAMKIREAGRKIVCQGAVRAVSFTSSPWQQYERGRKGGRKSLAHVPDSLAGKPRALPASNRVVSGGRAGRVLVLDACMLTPDQDSGSLRMFRILELLQSLSYRVSFAPIDLEYKASYTERLQERGVEVLCRPYIGSLERYLDRHAREFSVIVLSRVGVADRYIGRARKTAPDALIVFDTVDLHFVREKRQARLEDDKHLLELANHRMRQELAVAAQADVTLVVSPTEKELLERHSPGLRVEVLSNIHEVYGSRTAWAERAGILFVGGFNHPPNTDAVLYFVEDILPMVRESLGDVPVYIVGSHPTPQVQSVASAQVHVTGYVEDLSYYFDRCRISVAPLRYGAGVKGKVNMSMSYGVPVVASSMAVEGMHLRHGVDVFVADTPRGFADCVVRVYRQPELWAMLSINGMRNIERHFSAEVARNALECVLRAPVRGLASVTTSEVGGRYAGSSG